VIVTCVYVVIEHSWRNGDDAVVSSCVLVRCRRSSTVVIVLWWEECHDLPPMLRLACQLAGAVL
jgi:hypothetical protein